jgi:hypothetical protein
MRSHGAVGATKRRDERKHGKEGGRGATGGGVDFRNCALATTATVVAGAQNRLLNPTDNTTAHAV